jgi:cell division protein FtsB
MTALIGGLVAVALGLIGLGMWFDAFLTLLKGGIPLLLLLGGALAVYLGFEEAKDKFFKKGETPSYEPPKMAEAEVEKYKAEVETLKAEIEELKKKTS